MSLINDALKRAQKAQKQAPLPPPDLPFRPVEPAQQRARRGIGLLLPAALAVVALLAAFLVWRWAQAPDAAGPIEANARTAPPPAPAPLDAAAAAPALASQPPAALQPASPPSPASAAPAAPATNATAVAVPPPPKPAPLRLQGIVFNPTRPSAMISGKTVFVGDKVGGMRVLAIGQNSATLAGAGQTNVLLLAE